MKKIYHCNLFHILLLLFQYNYEAIYEGFQYPLLYKFRLNFYHIYHKKEHFLMILELQNNDNYNNH